MKFNQKSSDSKEELKNYLKEIGVIKNTTAGSFAGAMVRQAKESSATEKVYQFLKQNEMLEDYRQHEDVILFNFENVFF